MTTFHAICLCLPLVTLACGGSSNAGENRQLLGDDPQDGDQQGVRSDQALNLGPLILRDVCAETQAQRCTTCEAEQQRKCDDCWDTCTDAVLSGTFVDCSNTCPAVGSSRTCNTYCDADPTECRTRAYEFEVVSELDVEHERKCLASVERASACQETLDIDCSTAARLETTDAARAYECLASVPCDGEWVPCIESLPFHDLAERIQSGCEEEPLDEDLHYWLEVQSGWVRPEVVDALWGCADLACGTGDFDECVAAWVVATLGTEP